jgi:mannan endo-1,4-beta-mannosidase
VRGLAVACVVLSLAGAARAARAGFVRVDGDHFVVDGQRFAFVGANLQVMHGEQARARYADTIAAAAGDGLRVGRVWAFGEGPADAGDWFRRAQLFRAGPDGFLEEAYLQLDRVIAEAGRRGLRLIVTLSNHWSDYGGIPMYLRWAGLPPRDREPFYTDERTRALFRAGLEKLLGRTNSVTGVRYVDDPTILSWELMNESSVVTPSGRAARRAWIADMARFIKARDPHHLVAAGLAGYGSREDRTDWIAVHRLPEIDYCDSHLYPQGADAIALDEQSRDEHTSEQLVKAAVRRLRDLIDDRAQLARFVVGKPLVIGEVGFHTDPARPWLGAAAGVWFRRVLDRLAADGGAGALAWIYQPWPTTAKPASPGFGIYVDQPLTDDVRGALRRAALRFGVAGATNPRLGAALGDAFLYQPRITLRREAPPHRQWEAMPGGARLAIAPEEFVWARFESAGVYRGGEAVVTDEQRDETAALTHAWGAGWGGFAWRFDAPASPLRERLSRLTIAARLSAEWPGAHGPPDGASTVELRLDGAKVATRAVAADDGAGRWEEFVVDDPALLGRLRARRRRHRIELLVPDVATAHGLCVYGARNPSGPAVDGEPGAIRVEWRAPAGR